jgi:hypothetical protein
MSLWPDVFFMLRGSGRRRLRAIPALVVALIDHLEELHVCRHAVHVGLYFPLATVTYHVVYK